MNDELKPKDDIIALEIELTKLKNELHDLWFILILITIIVLAILATWVVSVVMS